MIAATKYGGLAAGVQALCYIVGFLVLLTVMNPGDVSGWSEVQRLEFILERQVLFQWWNILIYLVFGVALVVLAAVLHGELRRVLPSLMSVATPFAFIWAGLVFASGMVANVGLSMVAETYQVNAEQAVQAWRTIGAVQDGLGGGVEVVGGIWVLLVSVAMLRGGVGFPKVAGGFGLLVGVAGIVTVVPGLAVMGAVFGLSQIAWFVVLAAVLLRRKGDQLYSGFTPLN